MLMSIYIKHISIPSANYVYCVERAAFVCCKSIFWISCYPIYFTILPHVIIWYINIVFDDLSTIGYSIVILNTLILFLSSLLIIMYSLSGNTVYSLFTILSGAIFLITQFAELSLPNSLNGSIIFSNILILVNIHGTHMILGCAAFCGILINSFCTYYDNYLEFIIIYWHLIECVWCILLLILLLY